MFNSVFERITYLEYQLQAKKALIDAFESGDKYVQMQEEYRNNLRHLERRIKNLEAKLESAYRSNIKMRKNWMDVFEDLEKEMKKTEKIFQPFYLSSHDLHHQTAGSGIGLSLARFIVEQHNGIIWAENRIESGTQMHVLLPIPERPISSPVKQIESIPLLNVQELIPTNKKEIAASSQTLLLVEDNKEVLNYLEKQFENEYKIQKAQNGKEAMNLLELKVPDLIISDKMMPEMYSIKL